MKTKLWEKEIPTSNPHTEIVDRFTIGNDKNFDIQLAKYDVLGTLAHAEMLVKTGLLNFGEWTLIQQELNVLLKAINEGEFEINEGIEDVHSQIEFVLTKRIGEAGKKIHSGRSRNDQILLDIKLFLREEIKNTTKLIDELFSELLVLSEKHKADLLPGYTHFQLAMPSSFGLWFGAYAESFSDDMEMLVAAFNVCNKNPLGSGAGYGSSFPLNRNLTTSLLEFDTMNYNVVYAQMTRGKTEKIVAMALSNVAATLSKFAYDICLYMNQNFGFISFPSSLTTGSSIMPHKKNPDIFELIRAKCNRIQSVPNELALLTNNLPSGYHRDMQLTKEILFPAISELKNCLQMAKFMLEHIKIKKNILADDKYNSLFSVEEVNKEVLSGIPFRDAYKSIAGKIESNDFVPNKELNHIHEGSIGNLCNDKIAEAFEKMKKKIIRE